MAVNLSFFHIVWVTVWKFQNFSASQILREINFGECRSFANLGALKFPIWWISAFLKVQKFVKIRFKWKIMVDSYTLHLPNLISRKIWVTEKFYNFHIAWAQCGNYGNSLSQIFDKNYVKAMVLLKKLLNSWFDEFFFQWEITEIHSHRYLRKISWKQWV